MVGLALPVPFSGIPVLPERGAAIAYLLVAGAVVLYTWIGRRASWPVATLLLYSLGRVLLMGVPFRSLQLLLLLTLAGVLYVDAVGLTLRAARRVAWALVLAAGIQGVLGILNLAKLHPSPYVLGWPLAWLGVPILEGQATLIREFLGHPMGWLTHPNFWGAYMALALPIVYALLGRWAALIALALTASTGNIGPIVSASAGLAVMAWRDLAPRLRPAFVLGCLTVSIIVSAHHLDRNHSHGDTTLSTVTTGRTTVWAAAWPLARAHWLVGNGLGSWRPWAEQYNTEKKTPGGATLQAHNEPYQLSFELGLVGMALAAWWLWHLGLGARALFWYTEPVHGVAIVDTIEWAWVGVVVVALVNALGSPTFHMPQQAGVALFAAARLEAARRSP